MDRRTRRAGTYLEQVVLDFRGGLAGSGGALGDVDHHELAGAAVREADEERARQRVLRLHQAVALLARNQSVDQPYTHTRVNSRTTHTTHTTHDTHTHTTRHTTRTLDPHGEDVLLRVADLVEDAAEPLPEAVVLLRRDGGLAAELVVPDVLQVAEGEDPQGLHRVLLRLLQVVQLQRIRKRCTARCRVSTTVGVEIDERESGVDTWSDDVAAGPRWWVSVPGQGMEGRSKTRLFLRSLPSVAERWPWLVITMNGFDGSEWIVTTRPLIVNCV